MAYIFIGLGNPGSEYEMTRHNAGRMALEHARLIFKLPVWEKDKKLNALISEGVVGKERVTFMLPETFMNKSGLAVRPLVKSAKALERLVVLHDDLDLPMGTIKLSFNRGSGGHRGVESIVRALKSKAFARVRVGISPRTPSGKLKKPHGEKAVEKFILGCFTPQEEKELKKVFKRVGEAARVMAEEGRERAMNTFN